jgi:hypothetical protein
MDLYHEFESNIIGRNNWETVNGIGSVGARILRQILKIVPPIAIPIKREKNYVVLGFQKEKFFPYFHFSATKVLWMYDAWEPVFDDIEKAIRQYKINLLFTASKQSAEYFNTLSIGNFHAEWVPEAVDVSHYKFTNYSARSTDVLQLGRKWPWYHDQIKRLENELTYKYEKKRGQIIFPTRAEFIDGLANARISICVPSNITHPEMTGSISTLTNRYLQSMASRCLIVGKLPYDMQFLFDYNPLIEIDEEKPAEQIKEILSNYSSYIPLIEKNYETVKAQHNWVARIEMMEKFIASNHKS